MNAEANVKEVEIKATVKDAEGNVRSTISERISVLEGGTRIKNVIVEEGETITKDRLIDNGDGTWRKF